jgi:hypothetical protein
MVQVLADGLTGDVTSLIQSIGVTGILAYIAFKEYLAWSSKRKQEAGHPLTTPGLGLCNFPPEYRDLFATFARYHETAMHKLNNMCMAFQKVDASVDNQCDRLTELTTAIRELGKAVNDLRLDIAKVAIRRS